jgi:hypothetical protein
MPVIPTRRRTPLLTVVLTALAAAAASLAVCTPSQAGATARPVAVRHSEAPTVLQPTPARAREAFQAQRYAEAYGLYAALADAGDAPAAWMALMMVSNGPALFGTEWSATPGQLRRWSVLAERQAASAHARIPEHDRGE